MQQVGAKLDFHMTMCLGVVCWREEARMKHIYFQTDALARLSFALMTLIPKMIQHIVSACAAVLFVGKNFGAVCLFVYEKKKAINTPLATQHESYAILHYFHVAVPYVRANAWYIDEDYGTVVKAFERVHLLKLLDTDAYIHTAMDSLMQNTLHYNHAG